MAFLFIFLGITNINAQQRIPIERAQRAFQARYYYTTKTYVNWPSAPNQPTPYFPIDGYYGDLSNNPDLARNLVADLYNKYFTLPYQWSPLYSHFLKNNNEESLALIVGKRAHQS